MKFPEQWIKLKEWFLDSLQIGASKETHELEEVEEKAEIPEEYMQRFTLNPLYDKSQVLAREEEISVLEKAYNNYKITKNALLLVGEAGAGMSSLLNASCSLYGQVDIMENDMNFNSHFELCKELSKVLGIEGAKNLEDLGTKIGEEERVIVFENVERLFLRKVGGFNLLEDFLLFIHSTKEKIYWITTINKYSLYYLESTIGFTSNFLSIVRLQPFDFENMKKVILDRNKDFEIVYLKPKGLTKRAATKYKAMTAGEKQESLESSFYKQMFNFSNGNISRSMLFWHNSVHRVKEKKVYVRAFEPKLNMELSLHELMILEAIMQHTSLSVKELRMVLRNSSKGSRLSLEFLREKNLLYPKKYKASDDLEYQINLLYLKELQSLFHSRLNRNFNLT